MGDSEMYKIILDIQKNMTDKVDSMLTVITETFKELTEQIHEIKIVLGEREQRCMKIQSECHNYNNALFVKKEELDDLISKAIARYFDAKRNEVSKFAKFLNDCIYIAKVGASVIIFLYGVVYAVQYYVN